MAIFLQTTIYIVVNRTLEHEIETISSAEEKDIYIIYIHMFMFINESWKNKKSEKTNKKIDVITNQFVKTKKKIHNQSFRGEFYQIFK